MSGSELARANAQVEVSELLARYARLVDGLAFDRLEEVFRPDAVARYAVRFLGADEHTVTELSGVEAIRGWLSEHLTGRPDLRRFVSGFTLERWEPPTAELTASMQERDMRITGTYRIQVRRDDGDAGWRIERLFLTEEIHH